MSKERLEEIERQLNRAEIKRENLDTEDFQNILEQQLINGNLKWLVKYAREQAERVQELEEDLLELVKQNKELRKSIAFYSSESYNAHLERLLDRSEKQIKRYREALEFYANKINYLTFIENGKSNIEHDQGEKARKALEGEE